MKTLAGKTLAGLASLSMVVVGGMAPAAGQPGEQPVDPAPAPAPAPIPVPEPSPAPPPDPGNGGPAPVEVRPGGPSFDAPTPDHQTHTGFFARAILGFGYQQMTEKAQGNTFKLSGLGTTLLLSAGYAIRPGLIIFGELGGVATANPSGELNGMDFGEADGTMATAGFGPGMTYYLPSNAHVGGSLLIGSASFTDATDDETETTETGVALSIVGGKEWWLGSNLGVGVIGHLMFGNYPLENVDQNLSTFSFTLSACATYN